MSHHIILTDDCTLGDAQELYNNNKHIIKDVVLENGRK